MSTDNPFSAGSDPTNDIITPMDPVAMDVGPILERCWSLLTNNVVTVVGVILVPIVPAMVVGGADAALQIMAEASKDENTVIAVMVARIGLNIVNFLVGVFLSLGTTRIFMNLAHGRYAELGMLIGEGGNYLNGLATTFLMSMAIFFGLLCLFVPGIILSLGLQFSLYAMLDRNLGPIEALTESWRITDGYKVTIFLINFVLGLGLLVFSCITLGFGYFIAIPVLALTQAVMYHSLKHLKQG